MQLQRYQTFNHYLKQKFGEKVYKVSIDAGFDCPNRDGNLAIGGCTYCDEGSRAPGINPELSIREQMAEGMKRMTKRYGAKKFIAYFQAFTNTYAHVDVLRQRYWAALDFPNVIGLSVSTRPDTISKGTLDLLEEIHDKQSKPFELWLELGLQTIHDRTNDKLNRWHTYDHYLKALERAKQRPNIKVCTHIILGLPGETMEDMHATIDAVSRLGFDGIKIHLLHVIKNTKLAEDYERKAFQVLDEDTYINLVCDCLEKLPPSMIIQRVTGEAERSKMIAPMWVLNKPNVLRRIDVELQRRSTQQGSKFNQNHAKLDSCSKK